MTRYAPTPEEAEAQIRRAFRGDIAAAARRWTRRLDREEDLLTERPTRAAVPLGPTRSARRDPDPDDLDTSEVDLSEPFEDLSSGEQQDSFADLVTQRQREVVEAGTRGLVKIAEGRAGTLTETESVGLEAIVHLEGRPALLVQGNSFVPPEEGVWREDLLAHKAGIEASIPRVGRVEVSHHPRLDWVGTAWLAGATTLITNRHVASEFAALDAQGQMSFKTPITASVDFRQELTSVTNLEYRIVAVRGVHSDPNIDLAVLEVEPTGVAGRALPKPLTIAGAPPDDLLERKVYVVGYPAYDSRNGFAALQEIFRNIFNVKRLQPGEIDAEERNRPVIHHDCSTLGGNSGSPVIDLKTHRVLGLHFGGRFRQGNQAVALWRIQDDPIFRGTDVNFV